MKSSSIRFVAVILVLSVFTNCATIIHGSRQSVSISSNPSKAIVLIDNLEQGTTPLTVKLSRKDHHTVQINLDGFMPYETKLTRKVDGWLAGNIVFGGLIGLAIDAATGAMYKLTPDQIQAELRSQTALVKEEKNGIFLTVVLQPDSNWERVGQLVRAN
ncbi:MAG: PEGA domain-containing protein [Prolixibacteraceae bacterium]|nr:PEGA domain-containing protein [Prolixibacteraceae bacterium]